MTEEEQKEFNLTPLITSSGVFERLTLPDDERPSFSVVAYSAVLGKRDGMATINVFASKVLFFELDEEDIEKVDGYVKFNYEDAVYVIRDFSESDSKKFFYNIPMSTDMMRQIIQMDEEKGALITVKVLREEDSENISGFLMQVDNLGVFSRENQEWVEYDGDFSGETVRLDYSGSFIRYWEQEIPFTKSQIQKTLV